MASGLLFVTIRHAKIVDHLKALSNCQRTHVDNMVNHGLSLIVGT